MYFDDNDDATILMVMIWSHFGTMEGLRLVSDKPYVHLFAPSPAEPHWLLKHALTGEEQKLSRESAELGLHYDAGLGPAGHCWLLLASARS